MVGGLVEVLNGGFAAVTEEKFTSVISRKSIQFKNNSKSNLQNAALLITSVFHMRIQETNEFSTYRKRKSHAASWSSITPWCYGWCHGTTETKEKNTL